VGVTSDPLALAEDVESATTRLLASAATLTDAAVAEPSLMPGWTRGHVLAHIVGNADGLTNLLVWARTGVETPMYATPTARADGIEAGAGRTLADHLAALRDSAERFATAVADMPVERWAFVYDEKRGAAVRTVWRRLREVEVHHVDLNSGYTPADWPSGFTHRLLHELVKDIRAGEPIRLAPERLSHPLQLGGPASTPPVTVSGTSHDLAAWLSGRGDGASLTVDPAGPLPAVPDWM
jgi:maleylpyruvate isomerase